MASELPPEVSELSNTDDAVVVVDRDGAIVVMSKRAEELFGVALDDIAGEFVEMLVPSAMRWGHQAYRRGFFANPSEREMDPDLEPHGFNPVEETQFRIHVELVPHSVDGATFVAAHITPLED